MIKNKKITQFALGLSALILSISTQLAQAQDTFSISGPIAYGYYYDAATNNYIYIYNGSFEATVDHDSTTPLTYTYDNDYYSYYRAVYSSWYSAVKSFDYVAYDSNGSEVFRNTALFNPSGYYSYSQTFTQIVDYTDYYNYPDYKYEQWYLYDYDYNSTLYREDYVYAYWQDIGIDFSEEISNITTYPDATDNGDFHYSSFYGYDYEYNYNTGVNDYHYISGTISEITGGDSDGDGIPDGMDACVESDLSDTVVVGENDSGVANTLLENGCTLSDMIALIQADEELHGKVVSGVAHFLNQMKDEGVISGKEKGAIQSATAKSNPKKSK